LKKKIKQQACPKSSITEAYLVAERTFFTSYYFGNKHNNHFSTLSVLEPEGTAIGRERLRYLTDAKYNATHLHVLLNCDKVKPYIG